MLYKKLGVVLFGFVFSSYAFAKVQSIESVISSPSVLPGKQVELTLRYSVTDDANTTGIGFKIFYDSDKLTQATLVESYAIGRVALQFQDDTSNQDNDSSTDKLLNISWADPFGGNWPAGNSFPLNLLTLQFTASSDFAGSKVNYRKVSNASGYEFSAPSVTIDKALDSDNSLTQLLSGQVSFTPNFSSDINKYSATVSYLNSTLSLTPSVANTASFEVRSGGSIVQPNNIPLIVGQNSISVNVTAENGDENTYTFDVLRTPELAVALTQYPDVVNASTQTSVGMSGTCNLSSAQISGSLSDDTNQVLLPSVSCIDNRFNYTNIDVSALKNGNLTLVVNATTQDENVQATAVLVLDSIAPEISEPASLTLGVTNTATIALNDPRVVAFTNSVSATDMGSNPVTVSSSLPDNLGIGSNTVQFTATDASGNVAISQSTIIVVDQGLPTITASGGTVSAVDANGVPSSALSVHAILNAAQANDVIDGVLDVSNNAPTTLALGANIITLTATDSAGNTATQTITINVTDQTKPVLNAPSSITVPATDNAGTAKTNASIQAFLATANATDNVDTQVTVTNDAPATLPIGTTIVTFTATDAAGNTQTAQASITIADENAPTLTAPASITVAATDANGTAQSNAAIQAFLNGATATDNVTTNLSISNNAPAIFPLGATVVTFSVSDGQNTTTAQATVTVTDQDKPTITAQGGTVAAVDANGVATSSAPVQTILNAAQANDVFDGVLDVSNNAPTTLALGANIITVTATDSAGNTATQTITINVTDQTKPVLNAPSSITVPATDNAGTAKTNAAIQAFLATATATDNVDTQVTVTNDAPATLPIGTTTVTFTATDTAGNTQTAQASITITDENAPTLTAPASITVAATDANGTLESNAAIQAFLNGATATDNVTTNLSISNNAPAIFPLGATVVTFTVSDGQNTTTAQATVTVTDQGKPTITAQGGTVAAVDANGVATSSAPVQTILNAAQANDVIDGVLDVSNNAPTTLALSANIITLTATDSAGNTATQTITINVTDQTKPVLTAPGNITVSATNSNGTAKTAPAITTFLASATVTDNVDTQVTVTNDAPATLPIGTTTVTFTATDAAGNTQTAQASITIADENAPTLTAPASITVAATDANGTAQSNAAIQAFLNGATATDNVTTNLSISNNAPAIFPLGATVVTFSVSDGQNTTTAQAIVTVTDQGKPTITAQGGTVAAVDANGVATSSAPVQTILNAAQANDVIDGVLDVSNNAPTTLALGANIITLTATDSAGNTATQTITINVTDQTKPVLNAPGNITVSATDSSGTAKTAPAITAFLASATVTDNVDTQITVTNDAPATLPIGTTTVTFTATDAAGNTQTAQASITIADENAPTLTAPASITVAATDANGTAQSNAAIQAFLNGATATDNVTTNLSISNNAPAIFPLGETKVTFSVSDGVNQSTQTATVIVTDQTAPEFDSILAPQSVLAGSDGINRNAPQIESIVAQITATDNVDAEVAIEINLPDTLALGENTLIATATDNAGNTAQMSVVIVVQLDPNAPELSVPDDVVLDILYPTDTIANTDSDVVSFIAQATANDTLDGDLSNAITNDVPATLSIGSYTVTFSVSDSAGNTTSDTAIIEVIIRDTDEDGLPDHVEISNGLDPNDPADALLDSDGDGVSNIDEYQTGTDLNIDDVAPILTIPADIFITATGKFTGVNLGQASATDAKDGALTPTPSVTGPFESGVTEILWTVNDAQGNVASATQMLFITPLVTLTPDSISGEGSTIPVTVSLSGEAIDYPVTVTLDINGTASQDDFSIDSTELTIESGTSATVNLSITEDNIVDSGEDIVISIVNAQNAEIGSLDTRTVTILEENVAPILNVVILQNDMQTKTISQDGGVVSLEVNITDVNTVDEHTVAFDENTNALPQALLETTTLTFDPSTINAGVYDGQVTVTDNGVGELSTTFEFVYRVIAAAPVLSTETDSDGDGISDAEEGLGDADNDGIPDYKDNIPEANLAPLIAGSTQVIEASPGTTIALGKTVFAAGTDAVGLTEEQVEEVTGTQDSDFEYPSGLLDFVISGAKPGASYRLLIPLGGPIPRNAVFRKFSESNGWSDFVEDANNTISSAKDIDGACPSLGSSSYQPGLTEGDTCLELFIEDGGANDTDGAVDGKVTDPSGIAIRFFGPPSSASSSLSAEVSELYANSGDTSSITLTAMDSDGRLLEGLTVSGQVNNGILTNFVEQGDGIYTAIYSAGSQSGVATLSVILSNGEEEASLQIQITLKKRDSGGSTSWLYLGLLTLACLRRVTKHQEK